MKGTRNLAPTADGTALPNGWGTPRTCCAPTKQLPWAVGLAGEEGKSRVWGVEEA